MFCSLYNPASCVLSIPPRQTLHHSLQVLRLAGASEIGREQRACEGWVETNSLEVVVIRPALDRPLRAFTRGDLHSPTMYQPIGRRADVFTISAFPAVLAQCYDPFKNNACLDQQWQRAHILSTSASPVTGSSPFPAHWPPNPASSTRRRNQVTVIELSQSLTGPTYTTMMALLDFKTESFSTFRRCCGCIHFSAPAFSSSPSLLSVEAYKTT